MLGSFPNSGFKRLQSHSRGKAHFAQLALSRGGGGGSQLAVSNPHAHRSPASETPSREALPRLARSVIRQTSHTSIRAEVTLTACNPSHLASQMALHSTRISGQQAALCSSQRPACHVALPTARPANAAQPSGLAARGTAAHRLSSSSVQRPAIMCKAAAAAPATETTQDLAEFDVAQTILLQVWIET